MSDVSQVCQDDVSRSSTLERLLLYFGISLVAATLLFVELIFFQIEIFINYYLEANQVIAVSLMGISLGGVVVALGGAAYRKRLASIGAAGLPVSIALAFLICLRLPSFLVLQELSILLIFFMGSMILSAFLANYACHRIYFADLVGAGLGVLAVTLLLPTLREEGSVFFAVGTASVAALMLTILDWIDQSKPFHGVAPLMLSLAAVTAFVLMGLNLKVDFLNMARDTAINPDAPAKIFSRLQKQKQRNANQIKSNKRQPRNILELENSRGSLMERIDIAIIKKKKEARITYFNGYSNDHISPAPAKDYILNVRNPNGIFENPSVLIIGTAAEGVTKVMRAGSPEGRIVGLEINPPLVELLGKTYRKYSRNALAGIEMHAMDARSYLKQTDEKFDIITALNTHRIRNIASVGPPEHLHTVEGLRSFFEHLTDRGFINLEERETTGRAQYGIARFLVTAKHVLETEFGAKDFTDHVIAYHWRGSPSPKASLYSEILIKKTPWTPEELKYMKLWRNRLVPKLKNGEFRKANPREYFYWTIFPGQKPDPEVRDNLYYKVAVADDPYSVLDKNIYNMDLITDDRPFPYDVFRDRVQHKSLMVRCGIYALLFVLIPCGIFLVRAFSSGREKRPLSFLTYQLYFALLGIGYLLVEIVLMQRLQIYLNSPIYSVATVLGTMLVASGLGSLAAERFSNKLFGLAFAMILGMLAFMAFIMPGLVESTINLPLSFRIIIVMIFVGALGFTMGMPFPVGLSRLKGQWSDRMAALSFGINGAFGASATPLALLTNKAFNFTFTFMLGAGCYLAALLVFSLLALSGRAKQKPDEGKSPCDRAA